MLQGHEGFAIRKQKNSLLIDFQKAGFHWLFLVHLTSSSEYLCEVVFCTTVCSFALMYIMVFLSAAAALEFLLEE